MNQSQIKYLRELSERLHSKGFSWLHEDYFMLTQIVPEMLCYLCVHGNKNDGGCFECFNESEFEALGEE